MTRFVRWGSLATLLLLTTEGLGAGIPPGAETPAVRKAIEFLKGHTEGQAGEAAIAALAMAKCGVPATDPTLAKHISVMLSCFVSDGYRPMRAGADHDLYEASCTAMALANIDPKAYKGQLQLVASYIAGRQSPNGCFDYPSRTDRGDTSVTQYALLGLWEAVEQGDAVISPSVWEKCAHWLIANQLADGSFVYRPEAPSQGGPTLSMTGAGIGGLLICRSELVPYFRTTAVIVNPMLTAIEPETRKYLANITPATIDAAAAKGMAWLSGHFSPGESTTMGQTPYYGLYGIERVGALSGVKKLGSHDWFEEGKKYVESSQGGDGSWNAYHGVLPNTAWAVLYLIRANALTVKKIQAKLAAGTLLGGRGLPKNLADLTVAGGRIVVRPMNGAVEGMLKVLEDPKAEDADAALAGLLSEYERRGPRVLIPLKDRFRKMLTDKDPGLRRVAAWALPRTGELDVVPVLIQALRDSDPEVMVEARSGLQLLFRRVDSPGPAVGATPEQIAAATTKWREWYNAIRPADQAAAQDSEPAPAAPAAAATAPATR